MTPAEAGSTPTATIPVATTVITAATIPVVTIPVAVTMAEAMEVRTDERFHSNIRNA